MNNRATVVLAVGLVVGPAMQASAAIVTYTNQADFIAATESTLLTLPDRDSGAGAGPGAYTVTLPGQLQIAAADPTGANALVSGPTLYSGSFPLAPNFVAKSGTENFDLTPLATIYSLGFTMYEPTSTATVNGCNFVPCVDSTFVITLFSGISAIGSFTVQPANNQFEFHGFHSSQVITSATIRETVGNPDNEFFGRFYIGTASLPTDSTVPLPGASLLLLSGLGGLGLFVRRRAA